jgi:hypothetical protein
MRFIAVLLIAFFMTPAVAQFQGQSWGQQRPLSVRSLIWYQEYTADICRRRTSATHAGKRACDDQAMYARILRQRGLCYGTNGSAGSQRQWLPAGPGCSPTPQD